MIRRTSLGTNAVALGNILNANGDVRHAALEDDTGLKESQALEKRDNASGRRYRCFGYLDVDGTRLIVKGV